MFYAGGYIEFLTGGGEVFPWTFSGYPPPPLSKGRQFFVCKNFFKMMIVRRRGVLPPTFSGNSNVLLLRLFLKFQSMY